MPQFVSNMTTKSGSLLPMAICHRLNINKKRPVWSGAEHHFTNIQI